MSGGAGYVLSKEALRRVVKAVKMIGYEPFTSSEDVNLGPCLQEVKVKPGDSRDPTGEEIFTPYCHKVA
jgi:glycoprotein-N-acetylgalactosamine 3-beta-galactosyltransferase